MLKYLYVFAFTLVLFATVELAVAANCDYEWEELEDVAGVMLVKSQNLAASGLVCGYYESGTLESESYFKNGIRDGVEKQYYEDGTLKYEIDYDDGEKDDVEKEYYANGTLKYEVDYDNGEKDGVEKEYYESGTLKHEVDYDDGLKKGDEIWYHEDGTLKDTKHYERKGNGLPKPLVDFIGNCLLTTTGVATLLVIDSLLPEEADLSEDGSNMMLTTLEVVAVVDQPEILLFCAINMDSLIRDIATGKGDTIDALAVLMDLGDSKAFGETLQANFEIIFPDADFDYHHVAYTIEMLS